MTILNLEMPAGWGCAWLNPAGAEIDRDPATVRSYDSIGRVLVWKPGAERADLIPGSGGENRMLRMNGRFSCDVECWHHGVNAMAARFGLDDREFARRWVATEVIAKLFETPVLIWLKQHGLTDLAALDGTGVEVLIREMAADGVVCGFGRRDNLVQRP